MDTLEELREQRAEPDMKIELLEYAESTFEEGEVFWFVDAYGNIQQARWDESVWIKHCFYQGHIFKTEKEARLEAQRRNLLQLFKMFRNECNGNWRPDFEGSKVKYCIVFRKNELFTLATSTIDYFPEFGYFRNLEDCERAKEIFGTRILELHAD